MVTKFKDYLVKENLTENTQKQVLYLGTRCPHYGQ